MKCENCSEAATVHLTEVQDGERVETHRCLECAVEAGLVTEDEAAASRAANAATLAFPVDPAVPPRVVYQQGFHAGWRAAREAVGVCECGEPARFLCDYRFPLKRGEKPGKGAAWPTCSAPLCDRCRTQTGVTFVCGSEGAVDSLDLCPLHERKRALGL